MIRDQLSKILRPACSFLANPRLLLVPRKRQRKGNACINLLHGNAPEARSEMPGGHNDDKTVFKRAYCSGCLQKAWRVGTEELHKSPFTVRVSTSQYLYNSSQILCVPPADKEHLTRATYKRALGGLWSLPALTLQNFSIKLPFFSL